MVARIYSGALQGIKVVPIEIEVDVLGGLPSFTLVGLGDTAIKESKERLTAALNALGYQPPRRKTIVSLAPASLKKEGSLYDVPITLAYLVASEQVRANLSHLHKSWFVGELGLDGAIRPVRGVLPLALAAAEAGMKRLYVPAGNQQEASAVADRLAVYAVHSLQQLLLQVSQVDENSSDAIQPLTVDDSVAVSLDPLIDFADIKEQAHAKRALLIAASAAHNVLLVGPPGSGKTLLAKAMTNILPPLSRTESYEVTSLYSIAGELPDGGGLIQQRPFRSPHHGASSVALVGGGTNPKPGEVSLAHRGVLFLDELPEFSRHALDQLRQPIEDGVVTVARSTHTVRYPARSILVAAMNPCKCGYLGSDKRDCQCGPGDVIRYQRRVSGPLLDRFDIHVMVADVPIAQLLAEGSSKPTSATLRQQAIAARAVQLQRQGKTNAELTVREIKEYCSIDSVSQRLLEQAEDRFHLSGRGVHRLLKVARTIADLEEEEKISSKHLAEALQYREQLKSALPDFI